MVRVHDASSPSLHQRGDNHGCSVEQVAEAEAVERCWSPAGEITAQRDEDSVDEGEDEGDGGEDEDDDGARGHGEAGPDGAVHGEGLEDGEAALNADGHAEEDGGSPERGDAEENLEVFHLRHRT